MKKMVKKVLEDIKSVKVQGANNIAIAGIKTYKKNPNKKTKELILSQRPTEPLLQNSLNILESSKDKTKTSKKLIDYIENSKKKIAVKGSKLIKNEMNVFSHCHSSTVIEILKHAKRKSKKKFVVYTLEVEPLLQGRQTAKDLAKAGIKVIVFPELAAEEAVKNCDLFLFGVDAFTNKGVANKIGTNILCKIAKDHKIPTYTCGVSLKYTNKKVKLEYRNGREVWDDRNEKIMIVNPAFDFTKKKLISGVISEFGILKYNQFLKKAREELKRKAN